MFFLLAMTVALITYIVTFNKDFNEEDLSKAVPFLVSISAISILLFILGNMV